jgi:2-polyprenyl-3-methyl-5-hydroxy-6-metoxy-1,4-benzoquinol methylase
MAEPSSRWQTEAEFFDHVAREAAATLKPVSPLVLERYKTRRRRVFAPEYRFRLAGDLRERRVLDVGCGDGPNSVLLSLLGARVDGVDISPDAVALAGRRAEMNGVADRTRFVCAPLETVDFAESEYDVIWCDAFLHHLIPDLDDTMVRFRRWVKPGGLIVMVEPVNLSPTLRRLRFAVAADTEHTPDERPLERAELAVIARRLPEVRFRYFRALGRVDRYVLPSMQFETAAAWRKLAYGALSAFDYALLSVPGLERLASSVVMSARVAK